jgi:hypothetical protein
VTIPHPDPLKAKEGQTKTQIWVYGGRSVRTAKVTSGLWCLDVETFVWERVGPVDTNGDNGAWPRGRYFHTTDRCEWNRGLHVNRHMSFVARPREADKNCPCVQRDACQGRNKLVVFGGMAMTATGNHHSPSIATPTSSDGPSVHSEEEPCVLNGVWVFDCITRRWTRPDNANVGMNIEEGILEHVENLPAPRYAHTSVVSCGRLVITGGQDLQNE